MLSSHFQLRRLMVLLYKMLLLFNVRLFLDGKRNKISMYCIVLYRNVKNRGIDSRDAAKLPSPKKWKLTQINEVVRNMERVLWKP